MKDYELVVAENKLRRKISKIAFYGFSLLCAFVVIVLLAFYYIHKERANSYYASIVNEIENSAISIENSVESDIFLLNTLGALTKDPLQIAANYQEDYQDKYNFLAIGFWDAYKSKTWGLKGSGIDEIDRAKVDEKAIKVLKQACNGKSGVSEPFYSIILNQIIVRYAVPLYNYDKKIIGALTATRRADYYQDFIKIENKKYQNFYDVFLVHKNGEIIALNSKNRDFDHISSIDALGVIYGNRNYFETKIKPKIFSSVNFDQFDFHVENNTYTMYKRNLKDLNWYVVLVDRYNSVTSLYSEYFWLSFLLILFLILVSSFLAFSLFKNIKKSVDVELKVLFRDKTTNAWSVTKLNEYLKAINFKEQSTVLVYFNIQNYGFLTESIGQENTLNILNLIVDTAAHKDFIVSITHEADNRFYLILRISNKDHIRLCLESYFNEIAEKAQSYILNLSFSVGITIAEPYDTVQTIKHKAQFALRQIKDNSKNRFIFYDVFLEKIDNKVFEIEDSMLDALKQGEFKLYLQPIINLDNKKIEGAEALVRWERPNGKILYPDDFIPLFEQNGFCYDLDIYMLELCCEKLSSWIKSGIQNIKLAVNQSKLVLLKQEYLEKVKDLFLQYDIPPYSIKIEIEGDDFMFNNDKVSDFFEELHNLGFIVSLDSFGRYYSSVNALANLKVDEIKFDKKFLIEANTKLKEKNKVLLASLVKVCNAFNLNTIVDGIESKEDYLFVNEINCKQAQGFYVSKAVSEEVFEAEFINSFKN